MRDFYDLRADFLVGQFNLLLNGELENLDLSIEAQKIWYKEIVKAQNLETQRLEEEEAKRTKAIKEARALKKAKAMQEVEAIEKSKVTQGIKIRQNTLVKEQKNNYVNLDDIDF